MPLDRQSIEKKDFPIGRRGYEPEAVDAHLSAVAQEVEQLSSSSKRRNDNLASRASEQIRGIVEAAEQTAGEIERQAEEDAREVRHEADEDARKIRADASEQAREYVDAVSSSSSSLLARVDAMEKELAELLGALRTGANRVTADLGLLQENMGELGSATGTAVPQRAAEAPALDTTGASTSPGADDAAAEDTSEPEPEPAAAAEGEEPESAGEPAASDDVEGARLVALNMALNGSPREETDSYLAEHYALPDREGLLEEVYATVDG